MPLVCVANNLVSVSVRTWNILIGDILGNFIVILNTVQFTDVVFNSGQCGP